MQRVNLLARSSHHVGSRLPGLIYAALIDIAGRRPARPLGLGHNPLRLLASSLNPGLRLAAGLLEPAS